MNTVMKFSYVKDGQYVSGLYLEPVHVNTMITQALTSSCKKIFAYSSHASTELKLF